MQADDSTPRDHFAPPPDPIEVFCLHCGNVYMSSDMRFVPCPQGACYHQGWMGDWICPAPGCDGIGFEVDIHPTATFADVHDEDLGGIFDDDEFADEAFSDFITDSQEDDISLPAELGSGAGLFADITGESDWLESRQYPYARRWQMCIYFRTWTQDSPPDASPPGRGDYDRFDQGDIPF